MNYRSVSDLARLVRESISKIPSDVDLIVGVPRSGLLVANLLALQLNIKFCDVQNFVLNTPLKHGHSRKVRHPTLIYPQNARHVLIIDDSIDSGVSLDQVKQQLREVNFSGRFTYAACFATQKATQKVDLYFEVLPQPRFFEWNMMHRPFLQECCIDIDGILCMDPTDDENDDAVKYKVFLQSAQPLLQPSYPLGILVTSRLEKYRAETELWLQANGFVYKKLEMLDLPDAETRRRLRAHAPFKAKVYRSHFDSKLFIESNVDQAREIAKLSGKHCLSYETQQLFHPDMTFARVEYQTKKSLRRAVGKVYRVTKKLLGRS